MKYIFAALVLISSVAHAQLSEYERRFTCGKTQFVISALTRNAQEKPIWSGTDPQSGTETMILQNTRTLTWTVVQYDQDMACVLHSGTGFRILTDSFKESP
jgi:predicted secreted Zn-dependent protease